MEFDKEYNKWEKSKKAILLTGDKEFKVLENEIKINWI